MKSDGLIDINVKDSFCSLYLAPLDFVVWLNAEWIYRPASLAALDVHIVGLTWRKVKSETDLTIWEAAWNSSNEEPVHIFKPSLLADNNIAFLAAYANERIVACWL